MNQLISLLVTVLIFAIAAYAIHWVCDNFAMPPPVKWICGGILLIVLIYWLVGGARPMLPLRH